jgi:diaminohydroxyphosphoribosylaminopyrimidine deaminase/5-amino-6-(5-phosphoribosylamino)uracil reductase
VNLKAAITLDGKIADLRGESKWITNELSRKFVHKLRAQVDAIMIGVGTVLKDDPELSVRLVRGRNPKRIILDSNLKTPVGAKVLGPDCIIASLKANTKFTQTTVWKVKSNNKGKVDIIEVLKKAGKSEIQSILIEGGKEVFTEALSKRIVDKVYFFVAPKIMGEGISVVGNLGIKRIQGALSLTSIRIKRFGTDVLIEGRLT